MRKIEKEMIEAIQNGENWSKANTMVVTNPTGNSDVYLHGQHIACCSPIGRGAFHIAVNKDTLRRWPTNTTKSRLRALSVDVYTKNFVVYVEGVAI